MPKNKGKGGKNRRRGKADNDKEKRELIYKEEEQEYAKVMQMLGNGRTRLVCSDEDKQRTGNIRGKMKKKVWINQGDIVLVSLRGFQDDKCDIIHKYNSDEVKTLKTEGEIIGAVAQVTEAEGDEGEVAGAGVEFVESDDSGEEDEEAEASKEAKEIDIDKI